MKQLMKRFDSKGLARNFQAVIYCHDLFFSISLLFCHELSFTPTFYSFISRVFGLLDPKMCGSLKASNLFNNCLDGQVDRISLDLVLSLFSSFFLVTTGTSHGRWNGWKRPVNE